MISNGASIVCDGKVFEHHQFFTCPVCGVGLWIERVLSTVENPVTIFCGNGRCESRVTTVGAIGKDIESANAVLEQMVAEERARQTDEYWSETLIADHE